MKRIPLFKVFMPDEVDEEIIKTLHSGYIAEGNKVNEFRDLVRKFLGNPYVVPMSSCTMALTIGYRLSKIERGDEVISTPLTSICTNAPLVNLGAKIVWADCEPFTGMVSPVSIESLISNRTKAIVVLHKDGDLARMDEILAIAKKRGIKVIEDAAHAFGAKYKQTKVGNLGDFTCFSFQAIKQITTGDGGVLTCKNEEDWQLAKKYKWLGLDKEQIGDNSNPWLNDIEIAGYKGNMNELSATIGLAQMSHVEEIINKYNSNGNLYTELFKKVNGVKLIERNSDSFPTYWTYVILVKNRQKLISALAKEGIASGVVHPRNDNYSIFSEFKSQLPGVDYFSEREMSLPCGWWVEPDDIYKVVEITKRNVE